MLHQKNKQVFAIDNSKNKYRKSIEDEEKELEALEKGGDPEEEEVEKEKEASSKSDKTNWEKRYKDLQSYHSKKEQELTARLREVESKLEQAENNVVYPKTEEEFKEWQQKYPESVAYIETMILKHSEKTNKELKDKFEALDQEKLQIARDRAYQQLLKLHPDFEDIYEEFVEWLGEQPNSIQQTISHPTFDEDGVKAAARTVDFYKQEKGLNKKKSTPDISKAADKVQSSTGGNPAENHSGKKVFKESDLNKMSDREFEKLQDEIALAQREGRFVYDLSGAAR